ncbi:unnamed protein product, partial [Meganyctiphanes norvegica]
PQMPIISDLNDIQNKIFRQQKYKQLKGKMKKEKKLEKAKLKKDGNEAPKRVPHTIESLREKDETMVEEEDEELEQEEATDAYANYYTKEYEPKIIISCSDNPHKKSISFIRELCRIIPNSEPRWRKRSSIKKMVKNATAKGFTDLIVVNEDRREPNGLLVIHLPDGPTALFRVSNVKICKDLRRDFKEITSHRPEVLLNHFKTRLGRLVARMLGALFHYEPQFKGRRVCTLHNQRDYIFFRHHRYEFKSSEKVALRELGPRFTLRLQWLQQGAFDGDYEWALKRHDMETSRRKFFL